MPSTGCSGRACVPAATERARRATPRRRSGPQKASKARSTPLFVLLAMDVSALVVVGFGDLQSKFFKLVADFLELSRIARIQHDSHIGNGSIAVLGHGR